MTEIVKHYFTFGQSHMTSYPLPPPGGRLADFWAEVHLPKNHHESHRAVFFDSFAEYYLPTPTQWSMEYTEAEFKSEFFPHGRLCLITEKGIKRK